MANEPIYLFNILPVDAAAYDSFLPVMVHNAQQSRQEKGNIAFDVFGKEQGGSSIYLFEQWQSQPALDEHMETPHLQKVINSVEAGIMRDNAEQSSAVLRKISTPTHATHIESPADTRNVIVTFNVKADYLARFKEALVDVVTPSRQAPGNLVFEVFQNTNDDNQLVVYERWSSAAQHEDHLKQPYIKALLDIVEQGLAAPLEGNNRLLLKDLAP